MSPFPLTPGFALAVGIALLVSFVAQPFLLKVSASTCGEKSPSWFTAFFALISASLASVLTGLVYGLTVGMLLGSVSTWLSGLGSAVLSFVVTSVIYSAFLRISVARGAAVAVVHWLISLLWWGGLALILKTLAALMA